MMRSPSLRPFVTLTRSPSIGPKREQAQLGLVARADDIDEFAHLVRAERRLRRHERVGLVPDVEPHPHVLTRQQGEVGIGDRDARGDRARRLVDGIVEEGQFALTDRIGFARERDLGVDFAGGARRR